MPKPMLANPKTGAIALNDDRTGLLINVTTEACRQNRHRNSSEDGEEDQCDNRERLRLDRREDQHADTGTSAHPVNETDAVGAKWRSDPSRMLVLVTGAT